MTDRKTFDARIIGSITSGVLLVEDFGKVHEAIEFLAGHPVWTHELPAVSRQLSPTLLKHYPDLPAEDTITDWRARADRLAKDYPNGLTLLKGTGERTKDPIQTAAEAIGKGSVAP